MRGQESIGVMLNVYYIVYENVLAQCHVQSIPTRKVKIFLNMGNFTS